MHFVSALPNAFPHHEFKGFRTNVQFECSTSPLAVVDGKVKVPTGPGLGVNIDPAYIKQHQPVRA
jgi:L-alanine-DL-glutamate epimerase-like enolase superfamily enzyme